MGTCFFFFDLFMPTPRGVRGMVDAVSTLPVSCARVEKVAYHEKGARILVQFWECRQQLADRCVRGGALCTARRSPVTSDSLSQHRFF